MLRNIDLSEITDGKLYNANDMVRIGVGDCAGCFKCCTGMGSSIVLDPYDAVRLQAGTGKSLSQLIETNFIELSVQDGLILPNMKMIRNEQLQELADSQGMDEKFDCCGFLDNNGRCSIHDSRPGFCRLFPLGRIYDEGTFHYFNQINECAKKPETKVKIKKWLDTPDITRYEAFVLEWHDLMTDIRKKLDTISENTQMVQQIQVFILKVFFMTPYDIGRDFYEQFERRVQAAGEALF